ncbi:MAG: pantetheine-phosphate adenylyltransferase [Paludibacteraceae bacterium]|nr:pantetheine-phosphate adenylyltransferase [Paludibacteraceae bacterium]
MIAMFPGSFDPFTIGHADIVRRALPLFDHLVIAIGENAAKTPCFPLNERLEAIRAYFKNESKISVISYDGLTIDAARQHHVQYFIRGVRSVGDYEYERSMADANRKISASTGELIDTLLLYTDPQLAYISSSLIRDLYHHGADITQFVAK